MTLFVLLDKYSIKEYLLRMRKIFLLIITLILMSGLTFAAEKKSLNAEDNEKKVYAVAISLYNGDGFAAYEQNLAHRIFLKWHNDSYDDNLFTSVVLKITRDGSVYGDPEIDLSSENDEFDKNVLETVKSFKRFKSLPKDCYFPYVRFRIDFENKGRKIPDNANQIDFKPYMNNLQKDIRANWHPEGNKISRITVLMFRVYKDGTVKNLRIYKSSGDPIVDELAMQAVRDTKIRPLPNKFNGKSVDVMFDFNINIHHEKLKI